jgi:hypothetical protein
MGTRSSIGVLNTDGTVTACYVHWDGYIDHNGHILKDHYTDPDKIQALMNLGSLSILAPEIGEAQNFDAPTNTNWCLAYGRDRGETDVEADVYENVNTWLARGEEYNYLWTGSEWQVSCSDTDDQLRSLIQVILEADNDD